MNFLHLNNRHYLKACLMHLQCLKFQGLKEKMRQNLIAYLHICNLFSGKCISAFYKNVGQIRRILHHSRSTFFFDIFILPMSGTQSLYIISFFIHYSILSLCLIFNKEKMYLHSSKKVSAGKINSYFTIIPN